MRTTLNAKDFAFKVKEAVRDYQATLTQGESLDQSLLRGMQPKS
jgi:hypothetical protein